MKINLGGAIILTVAGLGLAGCASNTASTAATKADPTQRTYDQSDLQRSGRQSTGEAVHKLEPAATVREN